MLRLAKAATLGLCIGIVGLVCHLAPFGFGLEENIGLHVLFRLRGVRQVPADVMIVSMDKDSAAHLNVPENPEKWPRSLHARLTRALAQAGAAVIAFDFIFHEARNPSDDQAFADAIRQAGNVVLFEYLKKDTVSVLSGTGPQRGRLHVERLVPPIPPLAHAAAALAPFPLPKVPVKVSQYWTFKTGAGDTPTLPVVAFQLFAREVYDVFLRLLVDVHPTAVETFPASPDAFTTMKIERFVRMVRELCTNQPLLVPSMLKTLQHESILASDGHKQRLLKALLRMYESGNSQYLNFYGPPGTIPTVSYYQALQLQDMATGRLELPDVRGKAVFVGFSERLRPEQKDGFYTVFSQANGVDISGVEIAATAFANLLEDRPVRPLRWREHLASVFLWGLLLGGVCGMMSPLMAAVSVLGFVVLYGWGVQHQFTATGVWYPLVVPLALQAPIAFFSAVVWRYVETNKERRNIRRAFEYYLPETVVEQLSKSVTPVTTGSQLVYGTCLFTDASQYTSLAESMEPQELSMFMNEYYAAIFGPVRQRHGIISDVIGDAVLAIWTTPQPDRVLLQQACLAALDIASAVQQFKHASGTAHLPTRIGLHAGHMMLGSVGALDHYEYRAVGDIVNTASRLEGLNRYLGTRILVSDEVLRHTDGFLTRALGSFLLVGKSQPLVVYELLGRLEEADWQQRGLCTLFADGLRAYQRQAWDEALAIFTQIMSSPHFKEDGPSRLYVELCKQYRVKPPGGPWTGVVHMRHK